MVKRLNNMGKLQCKSPVPSDIDVAQTANPLHISEIATAAGLTADEYDLYGTTKAKVLAALCQELLSNPMPSTADHI